MPTLEMARLAPIDHVHDCIDLLKKLMVSMQFSSLIDLLFSSINILERLGSTSTMAPLSRR
jgi:hypothetical protein